MVGTFIFKSVSEKCCRCWVLFHPLNRFLFLHSLETSIVTSGGCCSGLIGCTKISVLMKVCIIRRLFSLMLNMQVSTVCSVYPWVRHPTYLSHY